MRSHVAAAGLVAFLVVVVPALHGTASARADWYEHLPGAGIVVLGKHCIEGEATWDDFAVAAYDVATLPIMLNGYVAIVRGAGSAVSFFRFLDWIEAFPVAGSSARAVLTRAGKWYAWHSEVAPALAKRFLWESGRWIAVNVDDGVTWTGQQLIAGASLAGDLGNEAWSHARGAYDVASDSVESAWEWAFD